MSWHFPPSFILAKIIVKDLHVYPLQVCVMIEATIQTDTNTEWLQKSLTMNS